MGEVRAGGMPDQQIRLIAGDLGCEIEQHVDDIVGAADPLWCRRLTHPRQVRIDPLQVLGTREGRLEACLRLAMVHPGPVKHEDRTPGSAAHRVHLPIPHPAILARPVDHVAVSLDRGRRHP